MTQIEQQMIDELIVTQGLTNNLAANLNSKGVPSNLDEGLDTLVPKVLQIESGDAQTPYEEWQEGFGYNWDSVVANAPMTNTGRILHIYTKVEVLKMASNFPTAVEIYTFNGSVYRQITMDVDKRLAFINDDYITNTSDSLQYVCVLFGGTTLGTSVYFQNLPIIYSNSKSYRQTNVDDTYANLLWQSYTATPLIRGIDCYKIQNISIHPTLEHLTYQTMHGNVNIESIVGTDTQVRLLKNIIDTKPQDVGLVFNSYSSYNIQISDEKLADLFYNDWIYNNSNVTLYRFLVTNNVRTFKLNPNYQLKMLGFNYLNGLPNAVYLTGTVTEDQTSTANDGRHGFNNRGWILLKNFPMWTVLEGATTGCLLPAQSANAAANFRFYSMQLERSNFAVFDELGNIDLDPTKSFVANLPQLSGAISQTITFEDTTFKNQFTEDERTQIVSTITTDKNWGLTW